MSAPNGDGPVDPLQELVLDRLGRLDSVLERTTGYLQDAQERVHLDIAPRLAATAGQWMPGLFGGRYERVIIDPRDLVVRVGTRGGELRSALALSHGTAEQLFLLLQLALVEHLTKASGETCPVLLDDVTAHFDDERETAVLDLLHAVSGTRQVVLFSQEDAVRRWAEERLRSESDALVVLGSAA